MHRSGLILNGAVSQLFLLMALFSESSGGGGDGGENIIGADDSSLGGDIERKRSNTGENIVARGSSFGDSLDTAKKPEETSDDTEDNMKGENCLLNKTNNHRNEAIKEEEIELERNYCNRTAQKQNDKEAEQADRREKIEEEAVKAVAEASKVVAGFQTFSQRLDWAIKS